MLWYNLFGTLWDSDDARDGCSLLEFCEIFAPSERHSSSKSLSGGPRSFVVRRRRLLFGESRAGWLTRLPPSETLRRTIGLAHLLWLEFCYALSSPRNPSAVTSDCGDTLLSCLLENNPAGRICILVQQILCRRISRIRKRELLPSTSPD